MAKEYGEVKWDQLGEHFYETGVDHVVLYLYEGVEYTNGVAWNGVTTITENKSGAEPTPLYADNIKYLVLTSLEEYGLTVECYTYPDEFYACNGMGDLTDGVHVGQQRRKSFALSFRTRIGNDVDGDAKGYKLNLVYGCTASPSEETNSTINDSPEAKTMSFEISTTPVSFGDGLTTSCVVIDSTKADPTKLAEFEKTIYGKNSGPAKLPLPDVVKVALTKAVL